MKIYHQYVADVLSGRKVACKKIIQACQRFETLRKRDDIYLDEDTVDFGIEFIRNIKHFLGKSNGKPFILEPWQAFIFAYLFGLKYKTTGLRVVRESYIQIARKAGKDAFLAAIALFHLIADGEAAPYIACLASSREQARILFEYIDKFAKSLDPKEDTIKHYRNYLKTEANNGEVKVFSADASRLDGLNISLGVLDEYSSAGVKRELYDVIKSSMAMRSQPLIVVITTAGFDLSCAGHDMYMLATEILAGVKQDDSFAAFIYELDEDDDWTNERFFEKCQPNLHVTVEPDFMKGEVLKAQNDATALTGVRTKTFNSWVTSSRVWMPQEMVIGAMDKVDLEKFKANVCYIGIDLSTVEDLSALSVMIPHEGKFYFKSYTFIPHDNFINHPHKALYQKFVDEGSMIVTPGNTQDYDYIVKYIQEINQILQIKGIYYDKYNATQFCITCTELGFNMVPFAQGLGNFNAPTKELERMIRSGEAVIDKTANALWQFGNVVLKFDYNNNCKPTKESNGNKIDLVITLIEALGGYMMNPASNDFELFVL